VNRQALEFAKDVTAIVAYVVLVVACCVLIVGVLKYL